jgi:hypothetical protein
VQSFNPYLLRWAGGWRFLKKCNTKSSGLPLRVWQFLKRKGGDQDNHKTLGTKIIDINPKKIKKLPKLGGEEV